MGDAQQLHREEGGGRTRRACCPGITESVSRVVRARVHESFGDGD